MSAMTAVAALSLLAWIYLLAFHGRFWSAGPVLAPMRPDVLPPIDVVIPARDEAEGIEAALRSLLAQDYPGELRITVVDDGSSDGTGAIARSLPDPRLTVIDGAPRPAGWSGKLWAVSQGVAAGSARLLFLTDADIVHDPLHLATLAAKLETGLDLVSEMVELRCLTGAERELVPAFVYFFALLYPFARVNDPRSKVAAAAGGTMLLRRAALERIGGIASLRGELIDDVALARRLKQHGPIWLSHSKLARSVRPYTGYGEIWRMVARTAYVQLRFSPLLLLATIVGLGLIFVAPVVIAVAGHGLAQRLAWIAWFAMAASYAPTLRRFGLRWIFAFSLPFDALFYMAATLGSALDHHRGRGVQWRNRRYEKAGA